MKYKLLTLNIEQFSRNKNALRKHEIQDWVKGEKPKEDGWLELAEYITDINDSTEEENEDEAFYSGDGTPERTTTSVAEAYDVEGQYDPEDEAQELVASKKHKLGDGRKVWHRVTRSDGKKQWTGRASLSEIVAGSGNAAEFEEFSCNIRYDAIPEEKDLDDDNGDDGEGN